MIPLLGYKLYNQDPCIPWQTPLSWQPPLAQSLQRRLLCLTIFSLATKVAGPHPKGPTLAVPQGGLGKLGLPPPCHSSNNSFGTHQ